MIGTIGMIGIIGMIEGRILAICPGLLSFRFAVYMLAAAACLPGFLSTRESEESG